MEENQGVIIKEVDIDIVSLIFYWLERWRKIVVSMLIFAVLLGGYKYHAIMENNQEASQKKQEETSVEEPYDEIIETKKRDLELQKDYLKNSVVMQMDFYHVSTGTANYYIEFQGNQNSILSAYSAYISSGELARQLYMADNRISIEDLQYLVSFIETSFYDNENKEKYVILEDAIDDRGAGNVVFQIQIRMPDSKLCEAYLKNAEKLIMEYSSHLQTEIAEHKLTLLSSAQVEMADLELQKYQSNAWSTYMESINNLETLQNQSPNVSVEMFNIVKPISSTMKYAAFGLLLGAFFACFILLLSYILGGKLQNIDNFMTGFGMPLLGIVRIPDMNRKLFDIIDTWIFQLREKPYAKISVDEQIKMAAVNVQSVVLRNSSNGKKGKVMLSGTMPEKDVVGLCKQISSEMEAVSCSSYKQIVFQSSDLRELDDYDGVLFLEKRGVSLSSLIVQERRLASSRGVRVLGAIVVY